MKKLTLSQSCRAAVLCDPTFRSACFEYAHWHVRIVGVLVVGQFILHYYNPLAGAFSKTGREGNNIVVR